MKSTVEPAAGGRRTRLVTGIVLVGLVLGIAAFVFFTDTLGDAIPVLAMLAVAIGIIAAEPIGARLNSADHGVARWFVSLGTLISEASWLLPAIGFVVVISVLGERSDQGQGQFFSAAAQVIPVLALALAIEATGFRERLQSDSVGRATAVITLLLLAYGEFEAFEGLADTEVNGKDAELVWAALTAGALGIVLVALRAGPAKPDQ